MAFEKEIRVAIAGHGPDDAATLTDIIGAVDAQQKLIVTNDELADGLRALLAAGTIRELAGHRYIDAKLGPGGLTFTPITELELSEAVAEYGRRFRAAYKRLEEQGVAPDEVMWPKLRAVYVFADGRHASDEDMDEIEALASEMLDCLEGGGIEADIGGFEVGPGTVQFDVDGVKDDDAAAMRGLVRPIFEAKATAGSTVEVHETDPWS